VEKNRLAVIGLGTAGIQAISHFLAYLDDQFEVVSISDPSIPILGIGESTNPSFIYAMEMGAGFNLHDELSVPELDSTVKFGTHYEQWRDHNFISPLLGAGAAIHLNTFKLKDYALPRFREKWGLKFQEIRGKVESIKGSSTHAEVTIDGEVHSFYAVMDCRGFPENYDNYEVLTNPTNHGLIHNVKEGSNPLHTKHIATQDGWMFVVPLRTRTSYGYMFNDTITPVDVAKANFSKQIGVPMDDLDNIEYSFKSFYAKEVVKNRIINNGNRAAFFEPMFANSLFLYDKVNRITFDLIMGRINEDEANNRFRTVASQVHDMIALFYHGGSIFNTPFWSQAKKDMTQTVKKSPHFLKTQLEFAAANEVGGYNNIEWVYQEMNLRIIDDNFGYGYFNPEMHKEDVLD
jgi:Tryptophan halogenase